MNNDFDNLMYKAGLTAQGCWDQMDDYDHAAIVKFAELIVEECAACCGSQADKKNIRKRFGLSVESSVQYPAPPIHGSVTSQYTREYNIPK